MKKILSVILAVLMLASVLSFTSAADKKSVPGVRPFDDIAKASWFDAGANFCKLNGYMNGTADYTFSPNTPLTRAQIAVILSVIAGVDTSEYKKIETGFYDVDRTSWYETAVKWMVSAGLTSGLANDFFGANEPITREQLCLFAMKFSQYLEKDTDAEAGLDKFSDKDQVSDWALKAVKYAVASGIISGLDNGTVAPKGSVTRAQMAVITKAYVLNILKGDHEHDWADATCTEPSYCKVCGIKKDIELGHDVAGICTKSGECARCHENVEAVGHDYSVKTVPATCTKDGSETKTCRICGDRVDTVLKALGHTTTNGVCSRCGADVFPSKYFKLIYDLKNRNTNYRVPDNYFGYYYREDRMYSNEDGGNDIDHSIVGYKEETGCLRIEYIYSIEYSDRIAVGVEMYTNGIVRVYSSYYFKDDNVTALATGDFYPSLYKRGEKIWFNSDNYGGDADLTKALQDFATELLPTALDRANELLMKYSAMTVYDLGFTSFR